VLGLAFKPGTDDVRQAPALDVIEHLRNLGASVVATDPQALDNARAVLDDGVALVDDAYACCHGADAVLLVTEWPELVGLDWSRVRSLVADPVVVDARNALDQERLCALGFRYVGVGRRCRSGLTAPARIASMDLQGSPGWLSGWPVPGHRGGRRCATST
jgi:UDPglucose 6-dehydrogenase